MINNIIRKTKSPANLPKKLFFPSNFARKDNLLETGEFRQNTLGNHPVTADTLCMEEGFPQLIKTLVGFHWNEQQNFSGNNFWGKSFRCPQNSTESFPTCLGVSVSKSFWRNKSLEIYPKFCSGHTVTHTALQESNFLIVKCEWCELLQFQRMWIQLKSVSVWWSGISPQFWETGQVLRKVFPEVNGPRSEECFRSRGLDHVVTWSRVCVSQRRRDVRTTNRRTVLKDSLSIKRELQREFCKVNCQS